MINKYRRLNGETVSMTLELPTINGRGRARHEISVSLMYDKNAVLREIVFVGRGKIGQGLDILLQDLGIKLSRAIQGRDPNTGASWEDSSNTGAGDPGL